MILGGKDGLNVIAKIINNGNRTEWNPIWSVIIQVMNKMRRPQSRGPICQSQVWLQTDLDETKSCYQLIKTKTKFEKEIKNQSYIVMKKNWQLTWWNVRQQCVHMTCSVHLHRHDMLTFLLTVLLTLLSYKHDMYTVLISVQIGLVIANHFKEIWSSFD